MHAQSTMIISCLSSNMCECVWVAKEMSMGFIGLVRENGEAFVVCVFYLLFFCCCCIYSIIFFLYPNRDLGCKFGVARLVGAVCIVDDDAATVRLRFSQNHLSEFLNRPNPRNDKLRRS